MRIQDSQEIVIYNTTTHKEKNKNNYQTRNSIEMEGKKPNQSRQMM